MTNELKHKTVGTELTQTEWEAIGTHVFNNQATGDTLYASSGTQLSKLAIASTNNLLTISGGIPAWTATPSVTSITATTGTINGLLSLVSTATKALNISTSLTGATAIDGAKMSFTAATTSSAKVSHGSSEGLYIYQDISGTKTGSARTEALSIVQTVTGSGACPDIYGAHIHWHNAGNPVVGNLIGLQVDLDDPGNACGNCMALDVYRDGANNTTTRDCMIRCANGGSATIPYAILLEGSYSAVFQLTIQGGTAVGDAVGGSNTKKIPVNVSNIAGETGTVYYIPLYTS